MFPHSISIPGVTASTAKAIIAKILSANGITRTDLALSCGVSAMTAGKIVSAMRDVGYATVGEEISARGRRSEFIYPAECFTFLIFDVGERAMYADVYDARENLKFTYTQPRNESVDFATDVASFVALVNEQLSDIGSPDAYRLSALLCRDQNMSIPPESIELVTERAFAAASYVKDAYPNECIAFVGANDGADISVISDGKLLLGKTTPKNRAAKHVASELEMLDTLTGKLAGLFELLIPDRVIIDSRSLHISRRFSSEFSERLTARTGMQKEELPELTTNDGIPFPSRAVIGQLIKLYAELISAK